MVLIMLLLLVEVQLHLLLHPAVHEVVQGGLVRFRVHFSAAAAEALSLS